MNEELDSQLSAMFDNELPAEECELLARRLSRDGELKARWGRYAVIGAVIRAERGVTLEGTVAGRVSAAISSEPVLGGAHRGARRPDVRWWQPLAGAALAASVAAVSILWLRAQALGGSNAVPALVASAPAAAASAAGDTRAATSDSFVVPPNLAPRQPMSLVPPTELADFVVAHSAFSWPVIRGSMLSALMVSEPGTSSTSLRSEQQAHDVHGNATQHPQK
jgi:negative regulator of sigma E activity